MGLHDPSARCMKSHTGLRSEEHTSELQSHSDLVCRLLLEKKKQADFHELSLSSTVFSPVGQCTWRTSCGLDDTLREPLWRFATRFGRRLQQCAAVVYELQL